MLIKKKERMVDSYSLALVVCATVAVSAVLKQSSTTAPALRFGLLHASLCEHVVLACALFLVLRVLV